MSNQELENFHLIQLGKLSEIHYNYILSIDRQIEHEKDNVKFYNTQKEFHKNTTICDNLIEIATIRITNLEQSKQIELTRHAEHTTTIKKTIDKLKDTPQAIPAVSKKYLKYKQKYLSLKKKKS